MKTTNQELISHEFGIRDEKGRLIGANILTGEFAAEENAVWGRNEYLPAGRYFFFRPHATRDGKTYGATQFRQHFNTDTERDAAITHYLAAAKKRAMKKAA